MLWKKKLFLSLTMVTLILLYQQSLMKTVAKTTLVLFIFVLAGEAHVPTSRQ